MPVDSTLVRDVVIVIPGIMGSRLVDGAGNPVWSLQAGSLSHALRTLGASIKRLQLTAGIGHEHPRDGVRAVAFMPTLHVIPGL